MLMFDLLLQRLIGKQKAQKLCSLLTAQWMHWCLVRYFWTFAGRDWDPVADHLSYCCIIRYLWSL